jgi:hypothetical protein
MELALGPVIQLSERLTGFERLVIEDAINDALAIADDEQDQQDRLARELMEVMVELEDSEGGPRPQTPPQKPPAPTTTEVAGSRATA